MDQAHKAQSLKHLELKLNEHAPTLHARFKKQQKELVLTITMPTCAKYTYS